MVVIARDPLEVQRNCTKDDEAAEKSALVQDVSFQIFPVDATSHGGFETKPKKV